MFRSSPGFPFDLHQGFSPLNVRIDRDICRGFSVSFNFSPKFCPGLVFHISFSACPQEPDDIHRLEISGSSGLAEGLGFLLDVENDEFSRFERGESYHDVDDSSGLVRG